MNSLIKNLSCLLVLFLILTFPAGCSSPPAPELPQGPSLESGYNDFINGEYAAAQSVARQFIQNNSESPYLAEAYYLAAISEEAQGEITNARNDFQEAIDLTDRPDLKAKSYKSLGDIAYSVSDYSTAIINYQNSLAAGGPDHPDQWLLLKLGSALQDNGQWGEARQYFLEIIADYPGTQTAITALERVGENHFALQFGAYQTAAIAYNAVAGLRQQGIPASMSMVNKNGAPLYLVHSGWYNTHTQAMAARDYLVGRFPQVIVTP